MKAPAVWLYAALLKLYPRQFERRFGPEMRRVFHDLATDAASQGGRQLARVYLREFLSLPGAILHEHLAAFGEVDMMETGPAFTPNIPGSASGMPLPGGWKAAVASGLPYLYLAMFIIFPELLRGLGLPVPEMLILALAWAGVAAILVSLGVAWRRGWPAWSASLYGVLIPVILFIPLGAMQQAVLPGLRAYENTYAFLVMPLALALIYYLAGRSDPVRGMLTLLPILVLVWMPVMEFVPSRVDGWVMLWIMLAAAAAAYLVTRSQGAGQAAVVMLLFVLACGLPAAFVRTYFNEVPPQHATPASLSEMFYWLMPNLFNAGAMILAMLLGRVVRRLGGGHSWGETIGYSLAVTGLLFNLGAHMLDFLINGYGDNPFPWEWMALEQVRADWLTLFSLLVYLAGAIIFCASALRRGSLKNTGLAAAVIIYPAPLTLLLVAPLLFGYRYSSVILPFGLYDMTTAQAAVVYAIGSAWLVLGAWLVRALEPEAPQPPARLAGDPALAALR